MIVFKDFVPRQLRAPRFGLDVKSVQGEYESLAAALQAANEWRSRNAVHILNVETVVLPNLGTNWEEGSTDPVLGMPSSSCLWHQFIRIWYEEDGPADE